MSTRKTITMMRFYHLFRSFIFSLLGKKTVGVRMLLIHEGKVLLIKHTYQPGWYTIGGGVDAGETLRQAMERELMEEVGAVLITPLKLFSVYYNRHDNQDDYVIFYIGDGEIKEKANSPEIAEFCWFSLDQLPADISPATRKRIEEYLGKQEISERW